MSRCSRTDSVVIRKCRKSLRSINPTRTSGSNSENEVAMFKCHVCGNTSARSGFVSEVFTLEGERRALVEHIPAQVCERCGEATFSRETTEKIRRLVHGAGRPFKTVPLDVFALA